MESDGSASPSPSPRRKKPDLKVVTDMPDSPLAPAAPLAPAPGRPAGQVTPTAGRAPSFSIVDAASGLSPGISSVCLTPQPFTIDMPSPGTFDPMLEHFLKPLEGETALCACTMERTPRAFRLRLEAGNVLLLTARRARGDFEISAADGTRIAALVRTREKAPAVASFVLRRVTASAPLPELAAMLLDEREIAPSASLPRVNAMRVVTAAVEGGGEAFSAPLAQLVGRAEGELQAAVRAPPSAKKEGLLELHSRMPQWDAKRELLTLDFPTGRASLASVQNFQLVAANDDPLLRSPTVLVHGLIACEGEVEHFSLDFRAPLSPLIAFAVCLAAQGWQ
ncbi:hypothetical protein AB1Y20_007340 [Prymnesium parvum]|uniref:Tubby C-terminal domain-containing protein n=1 Tax=Prymnesium parvum TaxID=97485 RepID=A0AB34IUN9_PRYPA